MPASSGSAKQSLTAKKNDWNDSRSSMVRPNWHEIALRLKNRTSAREYNETGTHRRPGDKPTTAVRSPRSLITERHDEGRQTNLAGHSGRDSGSPFIHHSLINRRASLPAISYQDISLFFFLEFLLSIFSRLRARPRCGVPFPVQASNGLDLIPRQI